MAYTVINRTRKYSTLKEDGMLYQAMLESPKRRNGTNNWKAIGIFYNMGIAWVDAKTPKQLQSRYEYLRGRGKWPPKAPKSATVATTCLPASPDRRLSLPFLGPPMQLPPLPMMLNPFDGIFGWPNHELLPLFYSPY